MTRTRRPSASERREAIYAMQRDANARELGAVVLSDDEAGALYALRSACLAAASSETLQEGVAQALARVEDVFASERARKALSQ